MKRLIHGTCYLIMSQRCEALMHYIVYYYRQFKRENYLAEKLQKKIDHLKEVLTYK